MKRFTLLAALGLCSISLFAQDAQKEEPKEEGFVFTTVKELPITSVKNQSRAGTCWCYSSMAFLESELLRMGKGEYDFSEMYDVHFRKVVFSFSHTTFLKCTSYTKLIWIEPMPPYVLTEMYLFPKEDHSMTLSME